MSEFTTLGVRARTLTRLAEQGIDQPLPVQVEAIPPLLAGRDAVIQAPTGSGKTLAFVLPMVERLSGPRRGGQPRALIVGPTRELATQIDTVIGQVDPGLRRALIYGGVGYGNQHTALRGGADIVVGCPGRLLDLAGSGELRLNEVRYLVLDEADEMLDAGFARDVEKLLAMTPSRSDASPRQTVLASATMPAWVQQMISRHLNDPARIAVTAESEPDLVHGVLECVAAEKVQTLSTLLTIHRTPAIVFHRTKHGAKKLARDLDRLGHPTAELQGNLSQNARDRALASFRDGRTTVLVATNVAARGIDVANVGLVVNYELPDTPQWLIHRIGRTARNGAEGRAVTMLSEQDHDQWRKLRRLGAPSLPLLDGGRLLSAAEWCELERRPEAELHHGHHPTQHHRPVRSAGPQLRAGSSRRQEGGRPFGRRPNGELPAHPAGRPAPSAPGSTTVLPGERIAPRAPASVRAANPAASAAARAGVGRGQPAGWRDRRRDGSGSA